MVKEQIKKGGKPKKKYNSKSKELTQTIDLRAWLKENGMPKETKKKEGK